MMDRITASSVIVSPPGKRQRYSSSSSTSSGHIIKIAPDLKGIREMCSRLQENLEVVAIPTECSYEIVQPFYLGTIPPLSATFQVPVHVYIPNVSIFETGIFWKQIFPKKSYSLKQQPLYSSVQPAIVTRFNESMEVVRRLASHLWPGPVILYAQVPHPLPGLTITRSTSTGGSFTDASEVQHYLALRNPCHPLSLKVCQEFYSAVGNARENENSCNSFCASPRMGSTQPSPSLASICRIASCESISSFKTSSSSLSGAPMEESIGRRTMGSHLSCLMVGRPMRCSKPMENDNDGGSGTDYVQNAEQVLSVDKNPNNIIAVLDGEAHTELVSVPTCSWTRPYPVALWIDADARVVRLCRTAAPSHHPSPRAASPHSTISTVVDFPDCSFAEGDVMILEARRVAQALRAAEPITLPFLCGVPPSERRNPLKDRIQQAVLLKWKVVME